MLTTDELLDAVKQTVANLPAVIGIEAGEEPLTAKIRIRDFLSRDEEEPWVLIVKQTDEFVHPLFGDTYACIELSLALLNITPTLPSYLDLVAAHAGPCLDHHRYAFGVSTTWNPDTGDMGIYGQIRLFDQDHPTLLAQLRDHVRSVVALVYLVAFRIWQLRLRRRVPSLEDAEKIAEEAHFQMLELLNARPDQG